MRYFLVSFVDENLRVYLRDQMRSLAKYRRNVYFKDSQEYYLIVKYLGEKLSDDELNEVSTSLSTFIKDHDIRQFRHPISRLKVGKKSELSPKTIYFELNQTPELNLFFRVLHKNITSLGIDRIPRKKDHNKFLGLVKLAQIRSNISQNDLAMLLDDVRALPAHPEIVFNNLTIIGLDIVKTKQKLHRVFTINLDE